MAPKPPPAKRCCKGYSDDEAPPHLFTPPVDEKEIENSNDKGNKAPLVVFAHGVGAPSTSDWMVRSAAAQKLTSQLDTQIFKVLTASEEEIRKGYYLKEDDAVVFTLLIRSSLYEDYIGHLTIAVMAFPEMASNSDNSEKLQNMLKVWVLDASPGKVRAGGDGEDHPGELISFLRNMPDQQGKDKFQAEPTCAISEKNNQNASCVLLHGIQGGMNVDFGGADSADVNITGAKRIKVCEFSEFSTFNSTMYGLYEVVVTITKIYDNEDSCLWYMGCAWCKTGLHEAANTQYWCHKCENYYSEGHLRSN